MSDTKSLLQRISTFRERLEKTPSLITTTGQAIQSDPNAMLKLAQDAARQPQWISQSLKQLTGTVNATEDSETPVNLLPIARKLLEEVRDLTAEQRKISQDVFFLRISEGVNATQDPLVLYHRETITATEALLRITQALPTVAETQQRVCQGVRTLIDSLKSRQGIALRTLELRRREWGRIERVARMLVDVQARRLVSFASFAEVAEELLDEVKLGMPMRFTTAPVEPVARYVAANSVNTAQVVARLIAHDYEWSAQPILPIATALMMDVGMLSISGETLAKEGDLTVAERRAIERHAMTSAEVLQEMMPELGSVIDAIGTHHEYLNGTGYPFGRKADGIPTLSRLLRVADSYAARCSDRPHRPAHDPRTALTDIMLDAEQGKYDRDFAEYLLNFSFHPVGTAVELTDGRAGVVAGIHTNKLNLRAPGRPVVAILTDAEGKALPKPEVVDLMASEFGAVVRALGTGERRKLFGACHPDLC